MTTILLLLLAYCCSVLFAWRFIAMKHLGLICVFSSHDIVSFVGGVIGRVGDGFRANSTSVESVQSNFFFHKLKEFLNKMLLFIHNQFKICCSIWNYFFFPLNLWMCVGTTSQWMALSELALLNWITDPQPAAGRERCGEGNLFWMLWSSLFSVRGWTHHAPLPLHQHRLTSQSAQWN